MVAALLVLGVWHPCLLIQECHQDLVQRWQVAELCGLSGHGLNSLNLFFLPENGILLGQPRSSWVAGQWRPDNGASG